MPVISDALCIDIWRLRRDKVLEGGLFTYESGDATLRIRRDAELLIVDFGEGTPKQSFELHSPSCNKLLMVCPKCKLGSLKLFLFEGEIWCKECHGLKADTLYRIDKLNGKIDRLQEFLNSREKYLLLEERRMLFAAQ